MTDHTKDWTMENIRKAAKEFNEAHKVAEVSQAFIDAARELRDAVGWHLNKKGYGLSLDLYEALTRFEAVGGKA